LLLSTHAWAATQTELLDQSVVFPPESSSVSNHYVNKVAPTAQTFRVGITGEMTRVDVEIVRQSETSLPLTLNICRTSGGAPVESDSFGIVTLAALDLPLKHVTFPYVGPYTSVDLSSFHIPVTVGDQLAIVARSDEPYDSFTRGFLWRMSHQFENPYPLGALYEFSSTWAPRFDNTDLAFKTYVTVPEPALTGMMTLALSALACTRTRFRGRTSIRSPRVVLQ